MRLRVKPIRTFAACGLMVAALLASPLHAQDIVGIWQGRVPTGKQSTRLVMNITKLNKGGLSLKFYILEQGAEPIDVTAVSLRGSEFKFKMDESRFVGRLSADGTSLAGAWIRKNVRTPVDFQRATKETAWTIDSSAHSAQLVTVDKGVQLEVLDWGGTGRPLIFLAGLGNTAHVFDGLAPKFTGAYHVYGITRRGYGASSAPRPKHGNYSADRLGDDVLAVIDALKLDHPILAGHSIAGEELSSIGSRHPEKVAGLIYLDAGWPFAYVSKPVTHPQPLEYWLALLVGPFYPSDRVEFAIDKGEQSYTHIRCPVLAIYAFPHPQDSEKDKKAELKQIDAFQSGIPAAQVVKLPNSTHYLFLSNQADVVREMNSFMAKLPS